MPEETTWKTIRVPEEEYERAKERKEAWGVTWGQYINPHAWHSVFDDPETIECGERAVKDDDAEEVAREVSRQIDYAQIANRTADEIEARLR